MKTIIRLSMLLLLVWPLMGFHGDRAEDYADAADKMLSRHPDRALEYLGRAIQIDPTLTRAYVSRGFLYLQRGETDLALADFDRVVELNPQDGSNYLTRGLVYSQRGARDRAAADFRKGCDLGDADACSFLKELKEAQ